MQIIACGAAEDSLLDKAAEALKWLGIKAEKVYSSDARVVSFWGDNDIPGCDEAKSDISLDDAQKESFWAYSSSSLDSGLCSDGNERLSCLFDDWRDQFRGSITEPVVEVVIEIHHFECDIPDDYVKVIAEPGFDKNEIVEAFKQALSEKERLADGCRFTWLDLAISAMEVKYLSAAYCVKQKKSVSINLDWSKLDLS